MIACGDGSVHFYNGQGERETATLSLGEDDDDVRVDERTGQVVVGFGSGGLATIDPETHKAVSRVVFKGHPEGFQLSGSKAHINAPNDSAILAVDRDSQKVTQRWSTGLHRLNFPMALDPSGHVAVIAYRMPAALARIDTGTGQVVTIQSVCGDSDDLFIDGVRELVICGAGHVDVFDGGHPDATVETSGGARTGLYVPELKTLFIAVPARERAAAIWALRLRDSGRR